MRDGFDEFVRSGLELGDDHWAHREFRLPDGNIIGYPRSAEIPQGAIFVGIHERHRKVGGEGWCGGWVGFVNVADPVDDHHRQQAKHTLVTEHPLHIEPSLACRSCASHGWIRGGRWSDA